MKIRDMELLVRVAETGSMSVAARQLHLTPAAVSGTIRRLEESLGMRLFERTTRSLHPTAEGLVLVEGCQELVETWERVLYDARGQDSDLHGTVHVSAPSDTSYGVLQSVVVRVSARHPHLRVVLDISDTVQHVHRNAIDIAIRYGAMQDSTLMARKLAEGPVVLVASPTYLAAHGTPTSLEELSGHRCLTLQLSNAPVTTWPIEQQGSTVQVPIDSPLCGDGYLVRRWAVEGLGIARKSLLDVVDDLEAGRLVRVLPTHTGGVRPVHAVFPSRKFLPARVRVLDTAIAEAFATRGARCAQWLASATA